MAIQTLTFGYKLPQTGDKGSVFFPALEDNIQRLNDHDHDGSDSARLTSKSVTAVTGTIASASWSGVSGKTGLFSQTVTMPTGFTYANFIVSFRDTSGDSLFLQSEAGTASDLYEVFCNDSAQDVVPFYGV